MPADPHASPASGTRGRPLGFERDRLVDSLMLAFWELGWNGASYPQLEQRTGVARSSMGNTVGPKPALMAAALERYLDVVEQRLLTPLREGEAGLADVRNFFRRLREGKRTDPGRWGCLMAIAMTEIGAEEATVLRLTGEYRAHLSDAITAALHRAHAREEIPEAVAEALTPVLAAAAIGLNVQARAGADDAELDALVAAVDAVLSFAASASDGSAR